MISGLVIKTYNLRGGIITHEKSQQIGSDRPGLTMLTELTNDDDRGQVGIGTLIVFIAMVLVAAIAAGVLINTAGFLQSSAEETGQQSSDQVTNRLQLVNAVGEEIDSSSSTIDTVKLTVKKAPGAGNIDIGSTIAQWVDSTARTTSLRLATVTPHPPTGPPSLSLMCRTTTTRFQGARS